MYTDDVEFHAVLSALSDGDQDAARRIYERFIDRLVALASSSLDKKNQAKIDPQSVAHSALMSFFGGQKDGAFELQNWGMVLGLLSHITFRKCLNRNRFFRQQRRNESGAVQFEDWQNADKNPGPEEQVMLEELLDKALSSLKYPERREMVELFLDGNSTDEVAERVGFSQRTVQRSIDEFRTILQNLVTENAHEG
jgi:RNA polymerase sigma factor (sigma-70 family)